MKMTLRKLSKLITKIDQEMVDTKRQILNNVSRSIFVHDASSTVISNLDDAHDKFTTSMDKFITLSEIRFSLRKLLGQMNSTYTINDMVTELRGIDFQRSIIAPYIKMDDFRLSDGEIVLRLGALKEIDKNTTERYNQNGSKETFNVVTLEDVQNYKVLDKFLRDRAEEIQDKLEATNSTAVAEIGTLITKKLAELGII